MKVRRLRTKIALAAIVAALAAGAAAVPAMAAQPPAGYPTSQTMVTASHPSLGSIPIRRGFWDSSIDQGFGYDKAWNKHNIWSGEATKRVMQSTNITVQGRQYLMKAYAGKYKCSGLICNLTEQKEVRGVYEPTVFNSGYFGWPVGGKMGMLTMYCEQGGVWRCPNWVTYAITNPGANNPYSRSATPSADELLSPAQAFKQAEILSSDEIVELEQAVEAGDEQIAFSYEPLPEVIPAP